MIGSKIGPNRTVWEKYGKWILVSLLFFAVTIGSIQYYQHYQTEQAIKASFIYDNMLGLIKKNDPAAARLDAEKIIQQYPKTAYAALAALLTAKLDIEDNKVESAIDNLKRAMNSDKKGPLHQIAKVRLARVLASRENYADALSLLSDTVPEGYATLFEEAKGDIYLLQNQKDKAREAYQAAQKAAPPGTPTVRLQLKQTELGSN